MYLKEEILDQYFNIDVSGNATDGYYNYYRRVNPKRITKTQSTEFKEIMDILIPSWETDKELLKLKHVEVSPNQMCICTQPISDICVFTHPSLPKGLQIGNNCVEKIDANLAKRARKMQEAIKKKRKEEEEHKKRYRECIECKKFNIPIEEESYKIRCKSCYFAPPKKRLTK